MSKVRSKSSPSAVSESKAPMGATFLGDPGRCGRFDGAFAKTPKVIWARVESGSAGSEWNGGAVVDAEIAVAAGSGARTEVAALDAKTGKTRWCVSPPSSVKQLFAKTACAIADGVVYVGTNEGLHALDAKDGSQRWVAKLAGLGGAPLVLGDNVYVGGKKGLYAINRESGRKAFTFALKSEAGASVASREGMLYFYGDGQLFALHAADGKSVAWKVAAFDSPSILYAGPAVTEDRVVFVDKKGSLACVDRATGKSRWTTTMSESIFGHPFAVAADRIVLKNKAGAIACYELGTGKLCWTSTGGRNKPSSIGHCGPVIAGTTVICMTVEDSSRPTTFLVGLDLTSGKLLWELDAAPVAKAIAKEQKAGGSGYDGGWKWHCTPFVRNGVLYAQADSGLVALR